MIIHPIVKLNLQLNMKEGQMEHGNVYLQKLFRLMDIIIIILVFEKQYLYVQLYRMSMNIKIVY
jgi:hypothetical protein